MFVVNCLLYALVDSLSICVIEPICSHNHIKLIHILLQGINSASYNNVAVAYNNKLKIEHISQIRHTDSDLVFPSEGRFVLQTIIDRLHNNKSFQ